MSYSTWEDAFRAQLAAKGYDNPSIHYDAMYGWCVLSEWGGKEINVHSTVAVRQAIDALPTKTAALSN